jgi:hypothetical protein
LNVAELSSKPAGSPERGKKTAARLLIHARLYGLASYFETFDFGCTDPVSKQARALPWLPAITYR